MVKDGLGLSVKCLLYADDQVIIAPSACGLQEMVNKMNDSVKKKGMKMNVSKTKMTVFQKGDPPHVLRFLRSMCGVSLKDKCRNSDVKLRCYLKKDVVTRIKRGMLRWFGHLKRMYESRLKKQIDRAKVRNGKVGKGRPRKFYSNHIGGMLK
ncbi:hypothetical protein EVAR_80704_1 [Eumeta japonica]|uniref:Reverse transcriptase domain-containing protein n=1 Tax=Eumeta variegata TaxID=151549 RepID=A0A4C1U3C8_EUMVA|nr:hypothetical protein EVAR_80704_1 [Eumeta japonica]